MGEVAATPPPDPVRQLREELRKTAAVVEGGTAAAGRLIRGDGDTLELARWARRLDEAGAGIRTAAMALLASGQSAPRVPPPRSRGALRPVPSSVPAEVTSSLGTPALTLPVS